MAANFTGRLHAQDLVLTGRRGVGKTATMKECARLADQANLAGLALPGSPDTSMSRALLHAESTTADKADRTWWSNAVDRLSRISRFSLTIPVGGGSISLHPAPAGSTADPYNAGALASTLATLAREVRSHTGHSGGVVICIDELQMTSGRDMRTLAPAPTRTSPTNTPGSPRMAEHRGLLSGLLAQLTHRDP